MYELRKLLSHAQVQHEQAHGVLLALNAAIGPRPSPTLGTRRLEKGGCVCIGHHSAGLFAGIVCQAHTAGAARAIDEHLLHPPVQVDAHTSFPA